MLTIIKMFLASFPMMYKFRNLYVTQECVQMKCWLFVTFKAAYSVTMNIFRKIFFSF